MTSDAPYGTWRSPIGSDAVATGSVALAWVRLDGEDVYWVEGRPAESGRNVIVRFRAGAAKPEDVTPAPFNARSRVHEYGGAAYAVSRGVVWFSNFKDGRIYRQDGPGAEPRPITAEGPWRYADFELDEPRGRLICVREDHLAGAASGEPRNEVVAVALDGAAPVTVLVSGPDFVHSPRLSPGGRRLAWLQWNHPNMPWDGCELRASELTPAGDLDPATPPTLVAGGPEESICEPRYSPDGALHFVSDRSGFWNLYRLVGAHAEPLAPRKAEFSVPLWNFGVVTYGFDGERRIICAYKEKGTWSLAALDLLNRSLRPIETPYTEISNVHVAPGGKVVFRGGSPAENAAIVRLDVGAAAGPSRAGDVLYRQRLINVDQYYLAIPRHIEFPTEGGLTAHGLFYAPKNRDFRGSPGERPPLIVMSHGGPTSNARTELDLEIQFWTSRGLAVLDVDYGGSTGYGSAYRRRLEGQWGVVDVDDCVNGARWLAERGEVDPGRLAITGGSAGGYTTLCALTFRDVFHAGASYYGVSDLEALAKDTHKFEARYTDRLVGPYPERADLYRARSPIHFAERLARPVIFFQGLEDAVVPPSQAERMIEALRAKGVAVEYVPFEGEQHGFRKAASLKTAVEREIGFYGRVMGFSPSLEPCD